MRARHWFVGATTSPAMMHGTPPPPPLLLLLLLGGSVGAGVSTVAAGCLGEYQECSSGECTLFDCDGPGPHCAKGEYRCPISNKCVQGATGVLQCPGLTGTHLDHTLDTEERVSKLIAATNLTEQIGQLTNAAPAIEHAGIPAYNWLSDDEHGVRGWDSTYFPDGPGLGASFDKTLLYSVGEVVGMEARAEHNFLTHTTGMRDNAFNGDGITVYGPNMNLVKDPRWGRSMEVYSEDPRLTSALTMGYVTGIQGAFYNATQKDAKYMQAGACCKHYVAYDLEGNGPLPSRVYFNAEVDTRSFWEHYMPVFHDCIVTAKGMHAMCSYNSMNGVPTCGDPNLLNGVLREQWGWDGFVVSDYDAYANIFGTHHYTKTMEEAAAVGINAGLDQEGGGTRAISSLHDAVTHGLTNSSVIQAAFRRLMRMRIRLGMFDPPSLMGYNKLGKSSLRTAASTALNRKAASSGMVLLKNAKVGSSGTELLPLDVTSYAGTAGSVLVAGPVADNGNNTLGNYACNSANCSSNVTSMLGGLRNAGTGLSGKEVAYIPGCSTTSCHETDFSDAVSAAAKAKLAVVVLGLLGWDNQQDGPNADPNAFEHEGHDRTSIALPVNQYKLAADLAKNSANTPVLCVLIHGGSIKLGSLLDDCTAIVDAWYPGQQGGAGFADVVTGKVNPAGRSPQTYYKDDEQLPKLGNMDLYAGNGTTYRYFTGKPDVPFGFGLSYTRFTYANLKFNTSTIGHCDSIKVSVDVSNSVDGVDGEEVVQLYVKTPDATVKAPRVRLADFARVAIDAGKTVTVELVVSPKYFSVVKNEGNSSFWHPQIAVEAGALELSVGGGQPDFASGVLKGKVTVKNSGALTTHYTC